MSPLQRAWEVFIWVACVLAFFAAVIAALLVRVAVWLFNLPSRLMGWGK